MITKTIVLLQSVGEHLFSNGAIDAAKVWSLTFNKMKKLIFL